MEILNIALVLGMISGLLSACGGGAGGDGSGIAAKPVVAFASWDTRWSVPGVTYSNGNLSISGNSAGSKNVRTDIGQSSGKWYWEIQADAGNGITNAGGIGILESIMPNNLGYIGSGNSGLSFGYGTCCTDRYWSSWPGVTLPSGVPPVEAAINAGTTYMFALDMDNGKFWAGQDGNWYNGGDPANDLNPVAEGLSGTVYPGVTFYRSSINEFTANFGELAFLHGVPAGFNAGFYAEPTWDTDWSVPGVTFSNDNLSISGNTLASKNVRTVTGKSMGKWYWELQTDAGDGVTNAGGVGILESIMPNNLGYIGSGNSGISFGYGACCTFRYWSSWPGVTLPAGAPPVEAAINAGTTYMFALDMDNGKFWAGQDGNWYNGGDPANDLNPAAEWLSGTFFRA